MAKSKQTKNVDPKSLERDEQVIDYQNFDFKRLVFSIAPEKNVNNNIFKRIYTSYIYDNGKLGPIFLQPGKRYSYGVQANNVDQEGNVKKNDKGEEVKNDGFRATVELCGKDETSESEQEFIDFLEDLRNAFADYIIQNKKQLYKKKIADDDIRAQVKRIYNVKQKKVKMTDEEGDEYFDEVDDPSAKPRMYLPLGKNKSGQIDCDFYGPGDKQVKHTDISGCVMEPTIKIWNIFVGKKDSHMTPQSQLHDATVYPAGFSGPKKRLASKNTADADDDLNASDDDEPEASLEASDSDSE